MAFEKTDKMLEIEAKHNNEDIRRLLPRLVGEKGLTRAAKELGLNKGTVTTWMLKMGLNYSVRREITRIAPLPDLDEDGHADLH